MSMLKGRENKICKFKIVTIFITLTIICACVQYCIANHDIVRLSSSVIWTIGTMILMIRDIIHLKKKK